MKKNKFLINLFDENRKKIIFYDFTSGKIEENERK